MADLHECDPIAAANQQIRDYIRAIGGRIETAAHRDGYERLVQAYFDAVRARDAERSASPQTLAA